MSQMCAGIQIDPEERARLAILAVSVPLFTLFSSVAVTQPNF